jgi:predicted lipid-binding transport protein (Tim44 family)
VHAAAAEAAEDDPAFAADAVKPAAARLFGDIQSAWDAGDRTALHRLVAPTLAREWDRRLDDFARRGWRNRVELLGEPRVEYVGLDATHNRVVVRIEAKLRDYVEDPFGHHMHRAGRLSEITKIREFWTLTKRNHDWVLVSIEQGAEGVHALDEKVIATPWSDEQSLRDEALVEGAAADKAPNITELAKVDYGGDAHGAALDLSLADGRFAPEVLEIATRRATQAWASAIDGDAGALTGIADAKAARRMLHPAGEQTRLVVRGPRVERIRITGVDAMSHPPTMTAEIDLAARRYLQDRDSAAIVAGSASRETTFTERWTFALTGPDQQPWQIIDVG